MVVVDVLFRVFLLNSELDFEIVDVKVFDLLFVSRKR